MDVMEKVFYTPLYCAISWSFCHETLALHNYKNNDGNDLLSNIVSCFCYRFSFLRHNFAKVWSSQEVRMFPISAGWRKRNSINTSHQNTIMLYKILSWSSRTVFWKLQQRCVFEFSLHKAISAEFMKRKGIMVLKARQCPWLKQSQASSFMDVPPLW